MSSVLFALSACEASDPSGARTVEPVEPPCASIVGSSGVAVISSVDPTGIVAPDALPTGNDEALIAFAGPDALGRYHLAEGGGALKRSDDGGCTWDTIGTLPDAFRGESETGLGGIEVYYLVDLFAGAASDVLYASSAAGGLLSTTDGETWSDGADLTVLSLAVDPEDDRRLRAYGWTDHRALWTSTDGGERFTATELPGDAYFQAAFADDPDVVALLDDGLWVATDGETWDARDLGMEGRGQVAWDGSDLYAWIHEDVDGPVQPLRLRRSSDLGRTFEDLPVEEDPEDQFGVRAVHQGLQVSGGGRSQQAVIRVVGDTTAVHVLDGYDDVKGVGFSPGRVVVGLLGPFQATPD